MVDEFYLDVNLELFVQWLFGNKNKYDHNILCTLKSNEPYGKTITFNYYNICGSIVIWANGIIEEQIFDDKENLLFYLHYKLVSSASLFAKNDDDKPPEQHKIILSGGHFVCLVYES